MTDAEKHQTLCDADRRNLTARVEDHEARLRTVEGRLIAVCAITNLIGGLLGKLLF